MNKYTLGTILGTAMLSLFKSQGSTLRLSAVEEGSLRIDLWVDKKLTDIKNDQDLFKFMKKWTDIIRYSVQKRKLNYKVSSMFDIDNYQISITLFFDRRIEKPEDVPDEDEVINNVIPYVEEVYTALHGYPPKDIINSIMFDWASEKKLVFFNEQTNSLQYYKPNLRKSRLRVR